MPTEVGALKVKLGLDDSGFNKGLSNAERKSKSVGSRIASGLGGIGKAFGKALLVGTAVGIGALVAFSKKALSVASDLEEVQNVVDTVFGESSEVIEKFAKNAGVQFGLSELAAKQYAGTMGALLTPSGLGEEAITSMSTELVGLAGDMASFFNIADEEAFNKLRAGISGETEPLKQLGINMSVANLEAFALAQGIDKTFNSMTQAEQATLRYNFIMDATSKVQGDFAKTSDSLANQQRLASLNVEELAKTFGKVLLPQAGFAMKGINSLITGLMPAFEGLADGLGDILSGTEGGQKKFQAAAGDIIKGIMKSIKTGLPKIVKVIAALVPVIVDTFTQIIPLIIETFAAEIPGIIEVLTGLIPGIIEALADLIPKLLQFAIDAIIALGRGLAQAVVILIPTLAQLMADIVKMLVSNFPLIIRVATDLLLAFVDGILAALPILIKEVPVIIDMIVKTIVGVLPMIIEVAIKIILTLIDGIVGAIPLLVEALPKIIRSIVEGLLGLLPQLVEAAVGMIIALTTALINSAPLLIGAIIEIGIVLIGGIIELIPEFVKAGRDLIGGLIDGMLSMDAKTSNAVLAIVDTILGTHVSEFEIKSPSKRMKREVGRHIVPGITEAIIEDLRGLSNTINNGIGGALDAIRIPQAPSLAGAGAGGDIFTFEVNVNLQNGTPQEAEEAGRIIAETANGILTTTRARGA